MEAAIANLPDTVPMGKEGGGLGWRFRDAPMSWGAPVEEVYNNTVRPMMEAAFGNGRTVEDIAATISRGKYGMDAVSTWMCAVVEDIGVEGTHLQHHVARAVEAMSTL